MDDRPPDISEIKRSTRIEDVIARYISLTPKGVDFEALCPFHAEKTPSFNVHTESQRFKCYGCDLGGDAIDFVQRYKSLELDEAIKEVAHHLTGSGGGHKKQAQAKPRKKEKAVPVPLTIDQARDHFTSEEMTRLANFNKKEDWKFITAWPYKNAVGLVELVTARFETERGRKMVLPFYWTGQVVKMKNHPVLLYNRDRLENDKTTDVLIVFGEKCAVAADAAGFIGVTWNGGEPKFPQVDLAPLKNRSIYLWPDDDPPGLSCANKVIAAFPGVKVVEHHPSAKGIEGADIADVADKISRDELRQHVYDTAKPAPKNDAGTAALKRTPNDTFPFLVLGIADDGRAYFISQTNRLQAYNLSSITKTQLMNLANVEWWRMHYGKDREAWENAQSDLIFASNATDFDPDRMRGRGGWRERTGEICYHDGKKTIGHISERAVYLRRAERDIGLGGAHATAAERHEVFEATLGLTLSRYQDFIRTLGWSVLAPFAGALPWRPALLMTAASGTGKSTIVNILVKPLALPVICSGGDSTAAGIRQRIGVDSCAVVVEESETDTQKKRQNRDDTLSLMRQSTSDDSPDVLKGTIDGRGSSFTLRSMFFFVSISPDVDSEADENRIFRISLTKAKYGRADWLRREQRLKQALTPKICSKIRAYTWAKLPQIIALADRVSEQVQLVGKTDNRTSFAESLLIAAHMVVFSNMEAPTVEDIRATVHGFYEGVKIESGRNENEEMVDKILNYLVRDGQQTYRIEYLAECVATGKEEGGEGEGVTTLEPKRRAHYRRIIGDLGVGVTKEGHVAIAKNHHQMMRILDRGKGYHRQLQRHPGLVAEGRVVNLGGGNTKNCVIIQLPELEPEE